MAVLGPGTGHTPPPGLGLAWTQEQEVLGPGSWLSVVASSRAPGLSGPGSMMGEAGGSAEDKADSVASRAGRVLAYLNR